MFTQENCLPGNKLSKENREAAFFVRCSMQQAAIALYEIVLNQSLFFSYKPTWHSEFVTFSKVFQFSSLLIDGLLVFFKMLATSRNVAKLLLKEHLIFDQADIYLLIQFCFKFNLCCLYLLQNLFTQTPAAVLSKLICRKNMQQLLHACLCQQHFLFAFLNSLHI